MKENEYDEKYRISIEQLRLLSGINYEEDTANKIIDELVKFSILILESNE